MKQIKFVGDNVEDLTFKPDKIRDSFYQICQFKNPYTNMYGARKVIFNEKYDIINMFEKEYKGIKLNKFMKSNSSANKYKVYPVDDLKYISHPNGGDFMQVSSELINRTTSQTQKFQDKCGLDSFNDMAFGNITDGGNNFGLPIGNISKYKRKVGGMGNNFPNGSPNIDNLSMINNNVI
jgi:hypothetical protein